MEWLASIARFFKGLFGPKGATQIGKGNQAVTGSTTGSNSPMVSAGRDVHLNADFHEAKSPHTAAALSPMFPGET
jgi:hypothetical protein